jgi:hypothetical protein
MSNTSKKPHIYNGITPSMRVKLARDTRHMPFLEAAKHLRISSATLIRWQKEAGVKNSVKGKRGAKPDARAQMRAVLESLPREERLAVLVEGHKRGMDMAAKAAALTSLPSIAELEKQEALDPQADREQRVAEYVGGLKARSRPLHRPDLSEATMAAFDALVNSVVADLRAQVRADILARLEEG